MRSWDSGGRERARNRAWGMSVQGGEVRRTSVKGLPKSVGSPPASMVVGGGRL